MSHLTELSKVAFSNKPGFVPHPGLKPRLLLLIEYSKRLKQALVDTVDAGIITGDLKGKTLHPDKETIVDMFAFLDEVESRLKISA